MMPFNVWFKRYAVPGLPKADRSHHGKVSEYHIVFPYAESWREAVTVDFELTIERLPGGAEVGVWRFNDFIVRVDVL